MEKQVNRAIENIYGNEYWLNIVINVDKDYSKSNK